MRDGFTVSFWFNARGNLIKTQDQSQRIDKNFYDGAGRLFRASITADPTESASGTYADADDLTGDQTIEQTDYWLDNGGRTRLVTNWMRDGSESSTLTGLPSAAHFDHNVIGYWYDAVDRLVGTADYGRDGAEDGGTSSNQLVWNSSGYSYKDSDSDGIPNVIDNAQDALPSLSNYSGPTDTSYDYILTQYIFDAAGRLQDVVDNANRTTRTTYDLAGRTLKTVENYVNDTAAETETDTDRTTEYVYDGFGRLHQLKALNPKGSGNGVQTQTTVYLYSSNIDRSWVSYALYPDTASTYSVNSTTGVGSITTTTLPDVCRKILPA